MPRFLRGTESPAELDPQGKKSQSWWNAMAELDTMETRIADIKKAEAKAEAEGKAKSFPHESWRKEAEKEASTARQVLFGGDTDGDFTATYNVLKKLNDRWPGPP